MAKLKAPPKDYDADLRPDPPPENATEKELHERADRFFKGMLSGAGVKRREPSEPSKTK